MRERAENREAGAREKLETRALWEECFPEDSREFTNYYYQEKLKENRIFIRKQGDGIVAMLQQNPYELQLKKEVWQVDYLVGVATSKEERGRGHMRRLLLECLQRMRREGRPFTFLMPASEAIYRPFGFRFIFDQPKLVLREEERRRLWSVPVKKQQRDLQRAADFMGDWLAARYALYTRRDAAYVEGLMRELESEDGELTFLFHEEELAGLQAHWGLQKRGQRLLYAEEPWTRQEGKKPAIMGRITHLERFLSACFLRESGELEMDLVVRDPLILENNGAFSWFLTEKESVLVRKEAAGERGAGLRPQLEAGIEELTSWGLGYGSAKELWPKLSGETLEALEKIETLGPVFLDEVV